MTGAERSVQLELKVNPKASREGLGPWHAGRLKVAVTVAPEKGKANAAVIKLLARVLGVPRSQIEIVDGHRQATKRLAIAGLSASELAARLPPRAAED